MRYPRVANLFEAVEHTPRHVFHWYTLLLFGVIICIALIVFAWFAFIRTNGSTTTPLPNVKAGATFNEKELQEILETYQTQSEQFEDAKRITPTIVDPGR